MRRAVSASSIRALPGMRLPSDSFMTSVGSSSPRLRSTNSRDPPRQHGRRPERSGQRPRHLGRADIGGDMGGEQRRLQPQRPIGGRQRVRGMVRTGNSRLAPVPEGRCNAKGGSVIRERSLCAHLPHGKCVDSAGPFARTPGRPPAKRQAQTSSMRFALVLAFLLAAAVPPTRRWASATRAPAR